MQPTVEDRVTALEATVATLVSAVTHLQENSTAGGQPPVVVTTPVPEGYVLLPKTGHIIPKPQPDKEMFVGYYGRVAAEVGGDPNTAGALMVSGVISTLPSQTGDPMVDWPINADAYANGSLYGFSAGEPGVAAPPVTPPGSMNVDNTATPTGVGNLYLLTDWGATEYRRKFHAVNGRVYAVKATLPPFAPVKNASPQVVGSCAIVPSGSGDIQGHLSRSLEAFIPVHGGAGGTCYDRMDWTPEIAGNDLYLIFALGPNQPDTDIHIDFQIPQPGVRDANT